MPFRDSHRRTFSGSGADDLDAVVSSWRSGCVNSFGLQMCRTATHIDSEIRSPTELLLAGVPMERVALLGHQSVKDHRKILFGLDRIPAASN